MSDDPMSLETLASRLPDPAEFRRQALRAVREQYAAAVEGREVHTPEDTFDVQRQLARTRELAKQYASTFSAVDKELATFQRDQLEALPTGVERLAVPDADGDLVVQLDQSHTYTFDEGQLLAAVAASLLGDAVLSELISAVEDAPSPDKQADGLADRVAVLLIAMVETVAAMGQLKMQVTKVRAFADQLARNGDTALAGVVRATILKSTETKPGAKFTRKEAAK
jgi:hypothetical protein